MTVRDQGCRPRGRPVKIRRTPGLRSSLDRATRHDERTFRFQQPPMPLESLLVRSVLGAGRSDSRRGPARDQRPRTTLRLRRRAPAARRPPYRPRRRSGAAGSRQRLADLAGARTPDEHRRLTGHVVHRRQRGLLGPGTPGAEPARVGPAPGPHPRPRRLPDPCPLRPVPGVGVRRNRGLRTRRRTRRGPSRASRAPRRRGRRPPDPRTRQRARTDRPVRRRPRPGPSAHRREPRPDAPHRVRAAARPAPHPAREPGRPGPLPHLPGRTRPAEGPRPQLLRPHGAAHRGPRRTLPPHILGELRYKPSGREPRLYAGSRRGIPYQARGDNAKGPYGRHEPAVLTPEVIARFRERADSGDAPDFLGEIWPLVAKEVETVYYETLLRRAGAGTPVSAKVSSPRRTRAPKRPTSCTSSGFRRFCAGPGTMSPGRTRSSRSARPPSGGPGS